MPQSQVNDESSAFPFLLRAQVEEYLGFLKASSCSSVVLVHILGSSKTTLNPLGQGPDSLRPVCASERTHGATRGDSQILVLVDLKFLGIVQDLFSLLCMVVLCLC